MSYRPRSPSPEYRQPRRYSPSRAVSRSPPPPPRRYDQDPNDGYYHGPGRGPLRYSPSPPPPRGGRYRSPSPPYRRYRDSPPPPPPRGGRYSPSPPPGASRRPLAPGPYRNYRDNSPPATSSSSYHDGYPPRSPPRRVDRDWDRDHRPIERYDDRPPQGGMAADREEEYRSREGVPPPRRQRAEELWERGRDVEELPPLRPTAQPREPFEAGPRKTTSAPNKDVIFIGLDEEITEKEFIDHLRYEHRAMIDTVKFVKKTFPDTGRVQCMAFAAFASLEGAQDFVENNSPAILWPALYAHSEPRKVKIDYAVPHVPGGESSRRHYDTVSDLAPRAPHDGMRDVGQATGGNRVLLLRGLDGMTYGDEVIRRLSEEIARLVDKPSLTRTAEETITRVVMIVDRASSQSWGMCFVELATADLAVALLPFLTFPQHQPRGFVIGKSPIAVSFASQASFQPVAAGPLGGQFLVRATRKGGIGSATVDLPNNAGEWVGYWHEHGGAIVTFPKSGKPVLSPEAPVPAADIRAFLGPLSGVQAGQAVGSGTAGTAVSNGGADVSTAAAGTGLLDLNKVGMMPIKIGAIGASIGAGTPLAGKTLGKKKDEAAVVPLAISGKNVLGEDDDDDPNGEDAVGRDTVLLSRTKGVGMILPTCGRKVAKNINKWNTKQKEIAAPTEVDPHAPPAGVSDANRVLGVRPPQQSSSERPGNTNTVNPTDTGGHSPGSGGAGFDYVDLSNLPTTGKAACLLCQRQFKSEDMVRKHVAQSDLHKTNLLDATTCEAGQKRKAAADAAASAQGSEAGSADASSSAAEPKYRDRAAERRIAFNQPDKPSYKDLQAMSSSSSSGWNKRKFADGPASSAGGQPAAAAVAAAAPAPPVLAPGQDERNLGNQLLAKMGWKSGTGLGSSEQGRVEPVLVQQFEARAGLGASKGVEAGRYDGKEGHKRRALDMAEQRYHSSK